jgi:hypothetical protein
MKPDGGWTAFDWDFMALSLILGIAKLVNTTPITIYNYGI